MIIGFYLFMCAKQHVNSACEVHDCAGQ